MTNELVAEIIRKGDINLILAIIVALAMLTAWVALPRVFNVLAEMNQTQARLNQHMQSREQAHDTAAEAYRAQVTALTKVLEQNTTAIDALRLMVKDLPAAVDKRVAPIAVKLDGFESGSTQWRIGTDAALAQIADRDARLAGKMDAIQPTLAGLVSDLAALTLTLSTLRQDVQAARLTLTTISEAQCKLDVLSTDLAALTNKLDVVAAELPKLAPVQPSVLADAVVARLHPPTPAPTINAVAIVPSLAAPDAPAEVKG
jgi:hypothetical protein